MANICQYKVKVKGKRNACYAFFGSMSTSDGKSILSETGTPDETILIFEGTCKWSVDSYCTPFDGVKPVTLPEDAEDAMREAEDKYWYNTVQERSEMFNVEVWCNSGDIDDPDAIYETLASLGIDINDFDMDDELLSPFGCEHYVNGQDVYDDCPEELIMKIDKVDFEEDEED